MALKEKNIVLQVSIIIVAWLCFFMLPFQFFLWDRSKSPFASERFVQLFISSNLLLVGFYYANTKIFIPKLLAAQKILLYISSILLCFFIYLTVMYEIMVNAQETKNFAQSPFAKGVNFKGPYYFDSRYIILF